MYDYKFGFYKSLVKVRHRADTRTGSGPMSRMPLGAGLAPAFTRKPKIRSGALGARDLVEQRNRGFVDLDELQPDISRDRVDLRCPGHAPHRYHRVGTNVECYAQHVTEVDLTAHGIEADTAGREVPAHRQQVSRHDRSEGNHLIRADPLVLPPLVTFDFLEFHHRTGRPLGSGSSEDAPSAQRGRCAYRPSLRPTRRLA